ncbi:hypothetical protein FJTKL_11187 [Diaporthe vaccinii]
MRLGEMMFRGAVLRLYGARPALVPSDAVSSPFLLRTIIAVMAASNFDLDAAMHSLSTDGLYHLDDFLIGQRISEMEEKGFPYFTEYGLDFYRTILDTRLRSLLGSILGNCTLGHWLRYQDYKGHIECFRRGGQKAGRNVLMIHCWAKGSQVNYFPRSHLHDLDTTIGKRSLYEVDQSKLELAGLSPHEQLFPDGGL